MTLAPLHAAEKQIVALPKRQPPSAKAFNFRPQCGSGSKQLHHIEKRIHSSRMPRFLGFQ
ncbi:hypothetical protein ACPOL_3320 [Acidisarcina polymorpha]|uniref:Uncharacterized protein n=1 Tax=Acidisarcina polymorpha TaxID=2211140 RepID=A0A2Z5G0C5_9BACT|nr:hypothetical protein ACPOL_3320 [Acidisarcina polymorpha]